jgi:hypothetical protein
MSGAGPKERLEILVNGHRFSVTVNLEAALRRLRFDAAPRVMWIDAICVNQEDFEERRTQVLPIGDIYSAASQTVVWLGKETEESLRVFDPSFLHSLNGIPGTLESDHDSSTITMHFTQKIDEYLSSSPSATESAKCIWGDILA